jgi:sugar phosphate permease
MPLAILGMAFSAPQALLTAVFMLLCGIAGGMQFPTSLVGAQNSVEQRDIGVATSTTNLFRSLGGAVGVACMSALLLALLQDSSFAHLASGALVAEAVPATCCSMASTPHQARRRTRCAGAGADVPAFADGQRRRVAIGAGGGARDAQPDAARS